MLLKDKKILILCKETYSYPLYFLTSQWKKYGNKIGVFFFNPIETMYNKTLFNDTTYYAFKDIPDIKIYDSNEIAKQFTELLDSDVVDYDYLDYLEDNYTHYLNLNNQIVSTQFFTRHYHWRNYFSYCKYEQQMNWLILNYQNIIRIVGDFKPDVILDCDSAELARCIMREVTYRENIPYITVDNSRVDNYRLFSYNLCQSYSDVFKKKFIENFHKNENELVDSVRYVNEYRNKEKIMASEYENTITSSYDPPKIVDILKSLYGYILYFYDQDFRAKNLKLKNSNKHLYNNSFEFIKYILRINLLRRRLMKKNKYFFEPQKGEKYVYMPLHLIPESTTFTMSPLYINEMTIIEAISKCLPAGWWLYVKEHQAMLGERGLEFYKRANSLPNVKMVQLNYYRDPKPWITNSQGVVTISGTSAYEAAMLGKKAIVFSDVPFSLIDNVIRVHSFEELPNIFKEFGPNEENIKSCAAYIETVKELGVSIDTAYLMDEGEKIIRGTSYSTDRFAEEINCLNELFNKAYHYYFAEKE